jgi:transcriptional regulator with XRE-family HTH domain
MHRLRKIREDQAYSQRALADASGVSAGTIARLEAGIRGAYPSTVRKLAQALGVTPRELYGDGD